MVARYFRLGEKAMPKSNKDVNKSGYVYFIIETNTHWYRVFPNAKYYVKIGVSVNVEKRISQLQTGNPKTIYLYDAIKCKNYFGLETHLHHKYKDVHYHNEWFKMTMSELRDCVKYAKKSLFDDCFIEEGAEM